MYLIIVGAGLVGSKLMELALNDGHDVAVIEEDEERAQEVAASHDVLVIHGNVARGGIIDEAGIAKADALVATTTDDSDNLMAMFMATEHEIRTLISVVNDQKHKRLFERLGVHVLVDPENIVAQHLYGILCEPAMDDVVTLPWGGEVFQISVSERSPLVGKSLAEVMKLGKLEEKAVIVAIRRAEKSQVAATGTRLQAGDRLTVFSLEHLSEEQLKTFHV